MKSIKEFPFEKARRITGKELKTFRKAIERTTGIKRLQRRGRPPKASSEKYVPVSIRLHPLALKWLKSESKKQGVPYQTIINQLVLKLAA
jgi:predicted DNA binding CopG/RHH family protein